MKGEPREPNVEAERWVRDQLLAIHNRAFRNEIRWEARRIAAEKLLADRDREAYRPLSLEAL